MNGSARVNTRCVAVSSNKSLPNLDSFGGGSNLMVTFRCICVKNVRGKHRLLQQYHPYDINYQANEGGCQMEKVRVTDGWMNTDRCAKTRNPGYEQNLPEAAARRSAPSQRHDHYPARTNATSKSGTIVCN